MKTIPRSLHFLCFIGLALTAALALNRVVQPSMSTILVRAVVVAALCGAPGLVYRKLWPLSAVLLPLGAYLLARTIIPVPSLVEGIGGQYRFYTEALRAGATGYVEQFFPLTLTEAPELRLLLASAVYWLTGAAAFLALGLRRALPAVVLTLVGLGFSLTVDVSARSIPLALLFLVLAACLLVLSSGLKRETWRLREILVGGAVGVVASALALVFLSFVPSAVATPWQDWRAWDPFRDGGSTYTFNWLQNYPKLLDPGNDMLIMRVESPRPSYWRASALDTFTGSAWVTSQAFTERLGPRQSGQTFVFTFPETDPTPEGHDVGEFFRIRSVFTNYLFVGGDPRSLTIDQDLELRTNDIRALHVNTALGPSLDYQVDAVIPELDPAVLVGRGIDYPEGFGRYLDLPFPRLAEIPGGDKAAAWRTTMSESGREDAEWLDLYDLSQQIVQGATDPYQITLRLEKYLRQFFRYSLTPPPSDLSSPYAAFLFDTRTGYCQHFAGTMALLLRFNGIPSRVAVGFTTGESDAAGSYLVSTNNAHSWVEAYFPDIGWVAFDPTPGRSVPYSAGSSTSPGFVNPFADGDISDPTTVTTGAPRDQSPDEDPASGGASGADTGSWLSRSAWLPWVVGLVVLLVAWPVGRSLWRRRGLHRGTPEERLEASLALLRGTLTDFKVHPTSSLTLEELMGLIEARLGTRPDPDLVDRAEAVLFGGRPATSEDIDRAEALRRLVRKRLRKRYGWLRAGSAWYGLHRPAPASGPGDVR